MAGPGGDEVARVSVRVVPDSSGFRSELARELSAIESSMKVTIPVEADTSGLRAEVKAATSAVSGDDITLDVGADTAGARAETAAFAAQTDALTSEIDVGADTTGARAEASATRAAIDAMKATIEVKVDVDKAGLGGIGDGVKGGGRGGLLGALTGALGEIPSLATGAAGAMSSFGQAATSAGTSALGVTNGLLGSFGAVIPVVGQAIGAVAQLGVTAAAVGLGIGVIGGSITALVGAAGAALSGLPALLLGVSAAGATVALGMDGIKKAAEAAVPGLNKLKTAVSTVFEKQLTPVFRDLGERVFPQLTVGLQGLASQVGGFAASLLAVVTTTDGIKNLNALFDNMGLLLRTITPSLQGLLAVFLEIGATQGVFRVLGEIISSLVNRVAEFFARLADSSAGTSLMVQSMEQLKGVLDAAGGALVELGLGAVEFFTGSGPGLRDMFRSIEETLKKIDFRSLGESFGSFARTVGEFIERIPQSTWDAIADAVKKVAEQFALLGSDPATQQFFTGLINLIPLAIEAFAGFLAMIRNVINMMRTFVGAGLSVLASLAEGINSFVQAMPFMPESVRTATAAASGFMRGLADSFNAESQRAAEAPGVHAPTALAGGNALGAGAAAGAAAGVAPMPGHMGGEAARAAEAVRGQGQPAYGAGNAVGAGAFEGATKGIAPMPDMSANRTTEAVGRVMAEAGAANAAGNAVGSGAQAGAKDGINPMPGDMGQTAAEAGRAVGAERPGFHSAGADVAAGAKEGIASGRSSVIQAAIDIAVAAFQAAKRFLGIASPSKLFRDEIGFQSAAGMAVGISAGTPVAVRAATAMATRVTKATQRAVAVSPGLKSAAQELLTRLRAGGHIFEDLSFKGMSANLGKFNDQLTDMFGIVLDGREATREALAPFLERLALSPEAVKAGQSVGQQIVEGINKALTAYTIKAPTLSLPGTQSKAFDYITDQARASYQAGIWSGTQSSIGAQPRNQQGSDTAALLAALERGLKLDTEQGEVIAKLNNMGQRTLARR